MKARSLVAAALGLVLLGLLTILVPIVPEVLYAPATTTYTTSYTTASPYIARYVRVDDDPHDSGRLRGRTGVGDIEFVTYERVKDFLRINLTLSQPLGDGYVIILISESPSIYKFEWEIVQSPYNLTACYLLRVQIDSEHFVASLPCSVENGREVSIEVPLSAIGNPIKIYPTAEIVYRCRDAYGPCDADEAPEFDVPRPEVDLSVPHVETLTRTFATNSTCTLTYSSPYAGMVPLAATLPWIPVMLLLVSPCLSVAAIYLTRKKPRN